MPALSPRLQLNATDRDRLTQLVEQDGPSDLLAHLRQVQEDAQWLLEEVRFRANAYSQLLANATAPDAAAWAEALSWFGTRISRGSAPLYALDAFQRRFGVVPPRALAPSVQEVRPHVEVSDADLARLAQEAQPGEGPEERLARRFLFALDALASAERFVNIAERHMAALSENTDEEAAAWVEALQWAAGTVTAPSTAHERLLRRFPELSPALLPTWPG